MIIFDTPTLPLPRAVTVALAKWGIVAPAQGDRAFEFDPLDYPRSETADAEHEWDRSVSDLQSGLASVAMREIHGISEHAQKRAWLRQYNARFSLSYRFFRMAQRLYPGRHAYVLVGPRRLRDQFRSGGLRIAEKSSAVSWAVLRLVVAGHALGRLVANFAAALHDGAGALNGERSVVWYGLSAAELRSAAGELNALDFVREGRLPLFRDAARIYVAAPWLKRIEKVEDARTVLCEDPTAVMPRRRATLRERVRLMAGSVAVAARIVGDSFRNDGLCLLLAPEYAVLPRKRLWIDTARPHAVIATNSLFLAQPLWHGYLAAGGALSTMLFYSTNAIALYERGTRDPVPADPGYRLLDFDRYEVWTEGQRQWLVSLGVPAGAINVAGIIVWSRYDAFRRPRRASGGAMRLTVFDVVPYSAAFWRRVGSGDHYYNAARMKHFLEDIVQAAKSVSSSPIEVMLKSKRVRQENHDRDYWNVVDELVGRGDLTIYPSSDTPLDAVAESHLVVSAPFSSPSVIASKMNIPSCFYDPAGILRPHPIQVSPEIPLIAGRSALESWMREKIAQQLEQGDATLMGRGTTS